MTFAYKAAAGALALALVLPVGAQPVFKVLINPGDQGEQSRFAVFAQHKQALEQVLARAKVPGVAVSLSTDASADLAATRSRLFDVYVAPAHVVGSALRFGYLPVLGLEKPVQAVLVALTSSPVASLEQAAGKSVGLPSQDSVVTYLLRGELNAVNTTLKRHFGHVYQTRHQDALLPCLQLKRCEVVAVERAVFERWVAAGEPVKPVMQTRAVPGLGVAVRDGAKPGAEALAAALSDALHAAGAPKPTAVSAADFDYVATLGYFTPRTLPGAQVADAATVARLVQAGGVYVDTRTEAEFKAGHPAGAVWVPYVEKSAKDPDFKASDDQFDLSKLPADKQAPLVLACNGAECWKSYKASLAAIKAGHTQVHWFRGGFPEWRAAGLKVASGG
ncbi:MAG: rhodanese-like domain-containing protein [Burkholderiaceae bacterium]